MLLVIQIESNVFIAQCTYARMIAGLFIGGALAVSGLLMQAMTRDPLASPNFLVLVLARHLSLL